MPREATSATPPRAGVLQRACDCGTHSHGHARCSSCAAGPTVQRYAEHGAPGCACGVNQVIGRPGTALDPTLGTELGQRFGVDFSTVRVHTDADTARSAVGLRAAAYTVGRDIVFAPGRFAPHTTAGQRLLVHELAHVVQQGAAPTTPGTVRVSRPSDAPEVEAERAADTALAGGRPRLAGHAGRIRGLNVFRQTVPVNDPFEVLRSGKKLTPAEAKNLLDRYEALPDADRDEIVRKHHQVGVTDSGLARLLAGLSPAEMKNRRELVTDIEERVQRIAVERITGKTLTQLGMAQGAFMAAPAKKAALAAAAEKAKKTGTPPPTGVAPADVAAEHDKETKRTSPVTATVTNAWNALAPVPGAQPKWNARAAAVITKVVDACKERAPEFGITSANLKWAPEQVATAGSNVFALSGDPILFGMSFVELAEVDPDFVVRTVVHELAGHPDFGSRFKSYEAQIYAEAHKQEPVLGKPWDTRGEVTTFGYIGTEIYSALREMPYETQLSAVSARELQLRGPAARQGRFFTPIDPASNIDNKIGLIKTKYAPGIAEAVLQGLYERFRIDPRISPDALAVFEELAEKHFPKVLKGVPQRGPTSSFEPAVGLGLERADGRSLLYTSVEANAVKRWANTALSAGLRLEVALDNKDTFVRLGVQTGLRRSLFQSLYGELRAGLVWGIGEGATSGPTAGAGLSYDFGRAQLGLVYDYLKAADAKDPDAHRAFLRLGLRF
ncbi:MAG: DUF4157 domain-containing protein [Pseudonocardiaceae bacterium]